MKDQTKPFMFVLPSILISFIYFLIPTSANNSIIIVFIMSLWIFTFFTIKKLDVFGRLIILMILSIPVSFISINGSTTIQGYLNWFNLFSFILFICLLIRVLQNIEKVQIDSVLIVMFISQLTLIISFLVNLSTVNAHSTTQFMMISFFILFMMVFYCYSKTIGFASKANLDQYLQVYVVMTTIISLSIIMQFFLYQMGISVGRIEVFGGNRTGFGYINFDFSFLSLLVLSNLFLIFNYLINSKRRLKFVILILIHILASLITSARTGITSFAVVLIIFSMIYVLVLNKLSFSLAKRFLVFLIVIIFSSIGLYFIFSTRGFGGSGRSEGNIESLRAFLLNPWFGYGLNWSPESSTIPHNFFIQFMVQTGLIFLVPLSLWLILLISKIRRFHYIVFLNILVIFTGAMFIPDILNSRFTLLMMSFGIMSIELASKADSLRVAHLLSSGGFSGAEMVAINVINSSPENIQSVYLSPKGVIESVLDKEGIEHLNLDSSISVLVQAHKIGVLYAHDFKASLKAGFSFSGVPVISHIHQNPTWFSSINLKSISFLLCSYYISTIVFVSEETLNEFVFYNWIKDKSIVLSNFVDSVKVINKSMESTEDNDTFDLVYLGRLDPVKNPIEFLTIVKGLKSTHPEIKAVMIGDGTLRADVEKYREEHNLIDNVVIKGYLSNPYPILKKSSLLIITSLWEGFGLNAVESMILGVPVLAASVGGLKSVVDSRAGFLCESTEEFIYQANRVLNDQTLLAVLSKGSIESSKRFTDRSEWKKGIEDVFRNIG